MLYESFKALSGLIEPLRDVKAVQWYNAQYDGTIYASPSVFIEFPDRIPLEQTAGRDYRGNFAVRIHIASASQAVQDNSINDQTIADHEVLAEKIMEILQGRQLPMGGGRTTSLMPSGWQHYHKYRGWMVTFVEFSASAFGI